MYPIIALSELRRLGVPELEELLSKTPVIISINGEPKYVLGSINEVVFLTGMVPVVKTKFKNLEVVARGGVQSEKLHSSMFTGKDYDSIQRTSPDSNSGQ